MNTHLNVIKELFLFNKKKALLLVFGSIVITIFLIYFIRCLLTPYTGLIIDKPEIALKNGKIYYSSRLPYSPVEYSGLQQDIDQIIAINGIPITGIKSFLNIVYGINTYTPIQLSIIRNETENLTISIIPLTSILKLDWIFTFLLGCVLICAGFILLLYLKESKCHPYVLFFFLYLLFIGVKPFQYENAFAFFLSLTGSFALWLLPIAALSYPIRNFRKGIKRGITVFLTVTGMSFIILYLVFFNTWRHTNSDIWFESMLLLEKIKTIADLVLLTFTVFYLCIAFIKERSIMIKTQIQWILAGIFISFSPYVFFDQLPYIFGSIAGYVISLGNTISLFMIIFPIFLLVSISEFHREKYKVFIPKLMYYIIAVSFLLLVFLIISPRVNSYLIGYHGFSGANACYFGSFLYVLVALPVVLSGLNIIEKLFYGKKSRHSYAYQSSLESELKQLKERTVMRDSRTTAFFQEEKMNEVSTIIAALGDRVEKKMSHVSKSIISLKKKNAKIITLLKEANFIDDIELDEKNDELSVVLNDISEDNLRIKELFREVSNKFILPPSFPSRVDADYIIKKAAAEIKKSYQYISIKTTKGKAGQIECRFSDIVQAFKLLFTFIHPRLHQTCEVTVHIDSDEKNSYFRIVYLHNVNDQDNNARFFKPYSQDNRIYLDLYVCKILIEKNSGTITAETRERLSKFIIAFPLPKAT